MKDKNKKLRLVLVVAICALFIVTSITVMAKRYSSKPDDDWNYWSSWPDIFSMNEGNVGIGTSDPVDKLDVVGNISVNGTRVINDQGQWVGTSKYPSPDYDSGWINLTKAEYVVFTHNLGGDIGSYVVDLTIKNYAGTRQSIWYRPSNYQHGACWLYLNEVNITVERGRYDYFAEQGRVRIWVYE